MYKASAGVLLPTSIIGSLPRPAWHIVQLGSRSFLEAMVNAAGASIRGCGVDASARAGGGRARHLDRRRRRYDEEVGGWSWQSYPLSHMAGFPREVALTPRRSR